MPPDQKLFCIWNGFFFFPTGKCERGNNHMNGEQILASQEIFLSLFDSEPQTSYLGV